MSQRCVHFDITFNRKACSRAGGRLIQFCSALMIQCQLWPVALEVDAQFLIASPQGSAVHRSLAASDSRSGAHGLHTQAAYKMSSSHSALCELGYGQRCGRKQATDTRFWGELRMSALVLIGLHIEFAHERSTNIQTNVPNCYLTRLTWLPWDLKAKRWWQQVCRVGLQMCLISLHFLFTSPSLFLFPFLILFLFILLLQPVF